MPLIGQRTSRLPQLMGQHFQLNFIYYFFPVFQKFLNLSHCILLSFYFKITIVIIESFFLKLPCLHFTLQRIPHNGCGRFQPHYRRVNINLTAEWKKLNDDAQEKKFELTAERCLEVLRGISDEEIEMLGIELPKMFLF